MKSQMQRKMVQIQHFPFILVYLAALITRSHILTTQAFAHHKYIFHTSESIINIDTNRHQRFQSLLSTRRSPQDDNIHQNEGIRLNKVFKATHSRREADKLIASGRVRVNGHDVIEKGGFKVIPFRDIVELDGVTVKGWEGMNGIMINGVINERLDQSNASNNNKQRDILRRSFEYIKYWKPIGVICTTDPKIKNNIIDAIHKDGYRPKHRIYPVGRLDKETSGLIILTSDGRLPNSVLRGEKKQPKIYHVTVDKPILDRDLTLLSVSYWSIKILSTSAFLCLSGNLSLACNHFICSLGKGWNCDNNSCPTRREKSATFDATNQTLPRQENGIEQFSNNISRGSKSTNSENDWRINVYSDKFTTD